MSSDLNDHQTINETNLENNKIIEICTSKLNNEPNNKRALLLRAHIYIKLKEFKLALEDLSKIEDDDVLKSTVYFLKGNIEKNLNNFNQSDIYLKKSIEADPNNVNAYFLRGAVLNLLGKYEEAITVYNIALEKDEQKDTKKNIFKLISKILDLDPPTNNENLKHTSKHDRKLCISNINNELDVEINKNLKLILSKSATMLPILNNKLAESTADNFNLQKSVQNVNFFNNDNNLIKSENILNKKEVIPVNTFNDSSDNSENNNELLNCMTLETNTLNITQNLLTEEDDEKKSRNFINTCTHRRHTARIKDEDKYKLKVKTMSNNSLSTKRDSYTRTELLDAINDSQMTINYEINRLNTCPNESILYKKKLISNFIPKKKIISNFDKFYEKGQNERRNANYENAIKFYTEAININPNIFKAYFQRAFVYEKLNKYELSLKDYIKAIELNPKSPYSYYNMGIIYDKLNDFSNAIISISKAIEQCSTYYDFYYNRGIIYKKNKQYENAINDFTFYLRNNVKNIQPNIHFNIFFNRADCFEKLNKIKDAIDDYNKCININQKSYKVVYKIACLFNKLGEIDKAEKFYLLTIEKNKNYSNAFIELGIIKIAQKEFDKALTYFNRALFIDTKNDIIYYNRACVYQKINQIKEALININKAIEINPNRHIYYYTKEYLLMESHEYFEAIDICNYILNFDNNNIDILYDRGFAYKCINEYNDALKDFDNVILLNNNNAKAYFQRALIYTNFNQIQEAIDDFSKVINLEPINANAYMERGTLYELLDKNELAYRDYEKSILANQILEKNV